MPNQNNIEKIIEERIDGQIKLLEENILGVERGTSLDFRDPLKTGLKSIVKDILALSRQSILDEVGEIVERIDVQGGGSGRRLKIQLLSKLKSLKDKENQ